YDAYLRGLDAMLRFTKEGNAQARQLFAHAVALDPAYAEAYAWLGGTYRLAWVFGWTQDPQTLERALALAHQALALDDTLPRTYMLLGNIAANQQHYEQAMAALERAITLEPSNADSYAVQGAILIAMGRPEEALRSVEQAMRLNPHYPAWYGNTFGLALSMTGRYAEAITALQTLLLHNAQFALAYRTLASTYCAQWATQLSQDPQTLAQAMA